MAQLGYNTSMWCLQLALHPSGQKNRKKRIDRKTLTVEGGKELDLPSNVNIATLRFLPNYKSHTHYTRWNFWFVFRHVNRLQKDTNATTPDLV